MRAQKKSAILTDDVTEEEGCELNVDGTINLKRQQEDWKAFEGKARSEVRLGAGLKAQYS